MKTLLIACGALAREIKALIAANGWDHLELRCLPAELHNRPGRIPNAVRAKISAARGEFDRVFVVYGDCGTGGELDRVLAEEGVERIEGAHCYAFFAGPDDFETMASAEPGTFYLTDFLARHFESLVIRGLGLDRYPDLLPDYFAHYRRLVYLAQSIDADLEYRARAAAARLGLVYHYRFTGYGGLEAALSTQMSGDADGGTDHRLLAGHSSPDHSQARAEDGQTSTARAVSRSDRPGRHARRPRRQRRLSRSLAATNELG